jgi:hypothetical protein
MQQPGPRCLVVNQLEMITHISWQEPRSKLWPMLDYAITRQRLRLQRLLKEVLITQALHGKGQLSDHQLVHSLVALELPLDFKP